MDYFNLRDKVAVVTGGSRGIGKSIASALGVAGAKVVVAARKMNLLNDVAGEITNNGGESFAVKCDLSDDGDIYELVAKTIDRYGRLDILVNNAGISPFVKKSEEVEKEEWEKVLKVNLTAPFLLSREAGKIMLENKWGRIINIASIGGAVALPRQIAYSVTKAGLIQMTKVLAVEWASGYNITVNAIAPGYIATDLTEGMRNSAKISDNLLRKTPMKRFGDPGEIATAVLYFASEYSSYTTGSVLLVDGGWTSA